MPGKTGYLGDPSESSSVGLVTLTGMSIGTRHTLAFQLYMVSSIKVQQL